MDAVFVVLSSCDGARLIGEQIESIRRQTFTEGDPSFAMTVLDHRIRIVEALASVGGLRVGYDGAQDCDLVLRLTERCGSRGFATSATYCITGDASPAPWRALQTRGVTYATLIGGRWPRTGAKRGRCYDRPTLRGCSYRAVYPLELEPCVSLVISAHDRTRLRQALNLLQGTSYDAVEVLILNWPRLTTFHEGAANSPTREAQPSCSAEARGMPRLGTGLRISRRLRAHLFGLADEDGGSCGATEVGWWALNCWSESTIDAAGMILGVGGLLEGHIISSASILTNLAGCSSALRSFRPTRGCPRAPLASMAAAARESDLPPLGRQLRQHY